ncbi:MAG: hypothetical protein HC905_22480 [Bacteroidales bacterium]|nr:hypothetical protein [Bacteroidales bacterium]
MGKLKQFLNDFVVKDEDELSNYNPVDFSTDELNLAALSEALIILHDRFLPFWDGIKNTFILFKIEDFVNELSVFAKQYKIRLLIAYAAKIKEDLEIINLDSLHKTLQEFPEKIEMLNQLLKQ